jgi:putative heme-binding domain-containing protein
LNVFRRITLGLTPRRDGGYSRRVNHRIAILLLVPAAACAQTANNPLDPEAIAGGGSAFRPYCTPCHGVRGGGGRGPDLTRGIYSAGDKDADLFRTIANGIPGTEMPGFTADFRDEDIWRIVAFIRSIARHDVAGIPGDRAKGEKLFWGKGGCGACHVVNGRGGRMGPELTRIGPQRSLQYLRDAVLAPSQDMLPGYATITVIRRDGTKLVGVERGFDNFSAQLMDVAGNYYSFLKSDVRSATRETRSLMPDQYGRLFTPAEIDDLLAYLVSLRGAEAAR